MGIATISLDVMGTLRIRTHTVLVVTSAIAVQLDLARIGV